MMPLALMLILAGIRWPRWRVALLAIFVIVGLVRLHCAPAQPFRVSAHLACLVSRIASPSVSMDELPIGGLRPGPMPALRGFVTI